MRDELEAGDVGSRARLGIHCEESLEVGGHHHRRRDAVALDQSEDRRSVEPADDHDRATEKKVTHGRQRAVVLQRTDDQVHAIRELRALPQAGQVLAVRGHRREHPAGLGAARPAGGSRRVDHGRTRRSVGELRDVGRSRDPFVPCQQSGVA